MAESSGAAQIWRFGVFEVNFQAGELRKHGVRIALQEKPLQVLQALLARPGQVVTREELRQTLWADATFVDFDHGINIAISKLRLALGDSAANPRFIETMSRHGYRFIAPVQGRTPPFPAAGKMLLAVLPFDNLSRDPEQDYFSDGLTEEMITQLGHLAPRRLGVIARSTAMHFRGTNLPAEQIGKELGVDYILTGSVRRSADRVRITAELVQAREQTYLWAETYDRRLSDVLDIQRNVARRIARSLMVELLPGQQAAITRNFTRNAAAHEAYLRGRYFWNRRTEDSFARAVTCFEQAIAEDPNYALAYAGLADAYNTLGLYGAVPPDTARQKATEAALQALEIDGRLAEAHAALAYDKLLFEWNWGSAEREFHTAIELNPNCLTGRQWYGHMLALGGRFDEGLAQMDLTLKLDPLSLVLNGHKGWLLYFARRYEHAEDLLRKTVDLDPGFGVAFYFLGLTYLQMGRLDDAIKQFQRADQVQPDQPGILSGLGQAWVLKGNREEAGRILDVLGSLTGRRYVSPYTKACLHIRLGEADQAFHHLERALEEHSPWMAFLNVDPAVDLLRPDARFQRLLRRIGSPG